MGCEFVMTRVLAWWFGMDRRRFGWDMDFAMSMYVRGYGNKT